MEQDAPPPPPPHPPCTSAAATGVGDPSFSLADTLRRLMSSARPELHSPPPPLPPPLPQPTNSSAPAAAAGVGDPSSSSAAHALRRLASSAQPELTHYSSPSLVPPPPPSFWSTQSASASSSAAVHIYQQRPPPPPASPVLDGISSLHARSLSQPPSVFPSFNTVGNILSTDLEAAAAQLSAPLRSLVGQQGQSNNLFGVAPSASQQYSSFLSSPGPGATGNALFPHLGLGAPAAAATALAMTHLSLLGGQQQEALATPMTPGMLLGEATDSFFGFGQPMLGSSSRPAGLPQHMETNPTLFGSSSSSWQSRFQLLGGGAHTWRASSTSGSVSNNGRSSAAMSTEPWHCSNLSGESSTMSSMPRPPSAGDKGSLGPPPPSKRKRRGDTFTDAEMEKIRKEKRLSDLVITDPRRVKTILCNRASAAKSAERRKSYRRGLQQQLQALDIEYTQLHGQAILQQEKLTDLESQTSKLRMRLEDLDNELNLKEAINETLISSIQSITLADSNAWSGLPQQMSLDGQCSNGGQYKHIRNNPKMSLQMVQMHQPPENIGGTITTTTRPGSKSNHLKMTSSRTKINGGRTSRSIISFVFQK